MEQSEPAEENNAEKPMLLSQQLNRGSINASWISEQDEDVAYAGNLKSVRQLARTNLSRDSQSQQTSDLAERAIHRVADARDEVQKKTFTKWINKYLAKINRSVDNLYEDLRDGHNLIALLEALSGISLPREGNYIAHMRLPREKGRMRFHRLQNVQIALDFLKQRKLRLVNIRNDDITDGNPKLTLGLIWTIILHFQVEDINLDGGEDLSARQALLLWAQRNMEGYDGIRVTNFSSSWQDGKAFNVIIHRNRPELIDMNQVMDNNNNVSNLDQAFHIAEKEFGVTRLLDSEDVDVDHPDERSIITYVSSLYDTFPQVPPLPSKVTEEEWLFAWEEYHLLLVTLTQWIQEQIRIMRNRKDIDASESIPEITRLKDELERFKTEDVQQKEADLKSIHPKYQHIEELSEDSRKKYEPPPGHEPGTVVVAWTTLLDAISDREVWIDEKYEKLRFFNELLVKINVATSECRKNLELAVIGIKQIRDGDESSSLPRNVETNLATCDAILENARADAQILKDKNYPKVDTLEKTLEALQEKCDDLKSEYNLTRQLAKQRKFLDSDQYKYLQYCIQWVNEHQNSVELFAFGNDLPGIRNQQKEFASVSHEVNNFDTAVDKCRNENKSKIDPASPEFETYCSLLSVLEKKYALLKKSVSDRSKHFNELYSFVSEATDHLIWMQQREDMALSKNIALCQQPTFNDEAEVFDKDLKDREPSVAATLKKGEGLKEHPAFNVVQSYTTALTNQLSFLQTISSCLQHHGDDLSKQEEFDEACERVHERLENIRQQLLEIDSQVDVIEPSSDVDICDQLQNVDVLLQDYRKAVEELLEQSTTVPCIKERNIPLEDENVLPATSLCEYHGKNLQVVDGEECTLEDNRDINEWKIKTLSEQRGTAPALLFRIPPVSKCNVEQAKLEELAWRYLVKECHKTSVKWNFCQLFMRLQKNQKAILAWTVESYKMIPEDEKDDALKKVKEDVALLNKSSETLEWKKTEQHVSTCNITLELCNKHIQEIELKLNEEKETEEKCVSYTSELNVLLSNLKDVHKVVTIRIITPLPQQKQELKLVVNEHQETINDLCEQKPKYERLSSEVTAFVEDYSTHSSVQSLSSCLDIVVSQWKSTWNVTHLYLEKLKTACVLVDQIDVVEDMISEFESRISMTEQDSGSVTDVDGIMRHQAMLKNIKEAIDTKTPLVSEMTHCNLKLKDSIEPLDDCMENDQSTQTCLEDMNLYGLSSDGDAWTERVDTDIERWNACNKAVMSQLQYLTDMLPEAEKAAAEKLEAETLLAKLSDLLNKIKLLEEQQMSLASEKLPVDEESLANCLENQQNTVKEVESLKPAYDNLQTGVVNFVNNELTRPVECLPQLKEQLLEMQQTWISLWLVCHVQLERIKGFKCTHHEIDTMESTVKNYENNLDEIEAAILKHENDMMQLRVQAANIKNMKSGCDEVDKNFKIMKDNLKSVQSIVSQFSEPLLPCKELEDSNERLIALEERWNEVKKRLERMFEDIDNKLMNLERNAIVSKDAAEIMSALALLGQKVDAVEDSMIDEANYQLPLDVESIKQAEEKHDSFKPLLAEVEMSADDLQKKFDQIKETRTPEVENVEEQFSKFNDRCKFVADLLDQRKPIYADLRDIIEHLNKDEATIDGFDKKIDEVDEKLKECGNDVDEVKSQVEKLKTLKDECDDVDSSLAELKSKIVATYQVVDGFDDKIKTCKELDACNAKADSQDEKWGNVKKRLDRELTEACDQLTQAERNVAASKDAAGISSELALLQEKVEAIEKAIEEEVNSQRPLDVQSTKNAEAQHDGLKSQLDDARSNADDLQKKFDQIKETKTPEVENVEEQFSKFNDHCKFVAVLLDQRKPIYADLRDIIEHLNKDEATIDGFDKKIDEVDEKLKECGNDVDEVKNQVEILKTLKDECDDVDSSLAELKCKIVATYQVVDGFDDKIKTCKELDACNAEADSQDEKWGDVKKRLDRELTEACDQLTQAERNVAASKDAAGISSELASLQEKVEAIEKAIEEEVNSQRPLDVQSIQNAEAQHDGLKSQLDDARSNADDLQKKFDQIKETKTPEVENVEEQFSKFNNRCKFVAVLLDQRKPIYADLRDIIEHLNKDEATIDGFDKKIDEVDEKLKECGNDVDEVKSQVEKLKTLKDECDDVDSSLAELKCKIVATYQVVDGFDDKIKTCKELDACNAKADSQDEKWGDVKKRLDRELTEACDQLTQAERNVAASKDAAGISSELASLQEKVEAIEKAIEEEVNSQRPLDVQSIQNAEAQHDGLKSHLDDARSNADDLQKKFDQIKETKTPEVENVKEQFSKFNNRCKFVAVLLDQRKPIYADLRDIIEHLNKDEATIDGFDKKIDEVDEKLKECGNDVDEVKNQVEILKTLKDECDDVDSSLGEVKGKIAATYQVVDGFDDKIKICKELDACNAKADAQDERWGDVKKRLDRELTEACDQLTQAERNVAASKDAAGISSELASLQEKVEAIEKAIEEEVNSQRPLDVQSIQNAEAQHDCLKPQLDDARSNADDLKKRFENIKDTRTPEVEKLEQQFPQFIEHCDFVGILLDQRKDIYVDLRGIVEHINRDEGALDDCAKELDTIDQKLEDCGNETDELKYQIEKLKALKENYDYMDDSLDGLKNNMASTRQLLDDCDDKVKTCKELDACELRFLALEQKWKNLKDRLDRQITDACNQLEVAERNAAVSKNVHDLLSALEQYRNEVNSVEDSILEENNTKLPLDTESISNVKEQHDGLKAPLGKAKAGADDLHKKFEDLKENETSEITELGEKFADFFKHWKFVTTLYEQRQQIYVVLLHIEESYLNSKDLVNKFEKNLDDYSKDADTMEELQHQIEQYETLKTSCVDGDESFVKLKEKIKSAEELFAHFDLKVQKCKEVEAYREKTSLLEERWDDLKKRLELKIMESSLKLAKAKKDSAARKDADDLVAALNKLAQDLDEIEEAIKEQSSAPVQTEPEFIQKVENKHEALEPKLSKTRSDGDDLHQKLDELNSDQEAADMPEVVEVKKQFESFDKKLNYVSTLYTERKKVIQLTKDTVDSMSVARNVIRTYATELLIHDIMADNQEDLTQQRDVLQKLDSEIPEHDPKFEELNEKSSSLDGCLHSFEEHGVTYDNTVPVACQDLAERWKDAKYQVKQRLSYVLVGKDKLTELQQAVQEENEKLQDKEILVNTQTPEGVEQDSKTLEDKIKKHEAVEADLLAQYPTVEHLNDLSEEFDAVARNYDKVAFEYDIPELEGLPDYVKPTLEELEERSSERKKIIQIEVITVTKRYDKLKNLISEKIEKYKVDYQIAKQREEEQKILALVEDISKSSPNALLQHDTKNSADALEQLASHLDKVSSKLVEILNVQRIAKVDVQQIRDTLQTLSTTLTELKKNEHTITNLCDCMLEGENNENDKEKAKNLSPNANEMSKIAEKLILEENISESFLENNPDFLQSLLTSMKNQEPHKAKAIELLKAIHKVSKLCDELRDWIKASSPCCKEKIVPNTMMKEEVLKAIETIKQLQSKAEKLKIKEEKITPLLSLISEMCKENDFLLEKTDVISKFASLSEDLDKSLLELCSRRSLLEKFNELSTQLDSQLTDVEDKTEECQSIIKEVTEDECSYLANIRPKEDARKLNRKASSHLIPLPVWVNHDQLQEMFEKELTRLLAIEKIVGVSEKQAASEEYWNNFVSNVMKCTDNLNDIKERVELFAKIESLQTDALLLKQEEEGLLREEIANALIESDCILVQADYLVHQLLNCDPNDIEELLEKWEAAFSGVVTAKEEHMNRTCLAISLVLKWLESYENLVSFIHDMNVDGDEPKKNPLKYELETTRKKCMKLPEYKSLVDTLNELKMELQSVLGPQFSDIGGNISNLTNKASVDYDQTVQICQDTLSALEAADCLYNSFSTDYEALSKAVRELQRHLNALGSVLLEHEHINQRINHLEQLKTEKPLESHFENLKQEAGKLNTLLTSVNCNELTQEIDMKMTDMEVRVKAIESLLGEHCDQNKVGLQRLEQFNALSEALVDELNTTKQAISNYSPNVKDVEQLREDIQLQEPRFKKMDDIELEMNSLHMAYNECKKLNSPSGFDLSCVKMILEDIENMWKVANTLLETKKRNFAQEIERLNQEKLDSIQKQSELLKAQLVHIAQWVEEKQNEMANLTQYGGLPETAQEQLTKHMSKLEETLRDATIFHEQLQYFMQWLGQAEKTVVAFNKSAISVIKDEIARQLQEHQDFEEIVQEHRFKLLELDKMGARLKLFSQKQDGVLIKNLLLSIHARWEKLISGVTSHGTILSDIHKKSKQFQDGLDDLQKWIQSAKTQLDTNQPLYDADCDYAKAQIQAHKEFECALASRKPVYDAVLRSGAVLLGKATIENDKEKINHDLEHLKKEWTDLQQESHNRQKGLEDAVIFSIQFRDSLQSLMEWLHKVEPILSNGENVHGEIHIVESLMKKHKILKKELSSRHSTVVALQESLRSIQGDSWVNDQMQELIDRWNVVTILVDKKQVMLDEAQKEAKELHKSSQRLLHGLAEVESNLHLQQPLAKDEFQLQEAKLLYQDVIVNFKEKQGELERVLDLAKSILDKAHPDAIMPVRQLIKVLQARWNQVLAKSSKYSEELEEAIQEIEKNNLLLEKLNTWLDSAEQTLKERNKQPITPDNIESLTAELQAFQNEMFALQPGYEKLKSLHSAKKFQPATVKHDGANPKILATDDAPSPMKDQCEALHKRWQRVSLMAIERQRKLQEATDDAHKKDMLNSEMFDKWRTRYMKWMKHKKTRVMDLFREIDKDDDGKITRQEFMNAILQSKFSTNESDMNKIADLFDQDRDGTVDYYKFVSALYPVKESYKAESDADKIENEVIRQVANCTCSKRFRVQQIAENKYRFGDNQQLRLVRILKSTVMVRVGGGWMALDEFLIKNDPCRAKRRTNTELRETLVSPAGARNSMTAFRTKRTSRTK
ncbi:microtubule-actin cross-linking factor 1-like isoform X3 [Clavelina lepadiformis]|uniref:microtubule-actin cross-linking factor 1-like isoform X3 n=1 Tax=Clavelina lepadiformis TaxID=159417 RepID=UPI004042557F